MAVTVLFIALALVAVALILSAIRMARRTPSQPEPTGVPETDEKGDLDDISEVRRGDRPSPPATPPDPEPDNLSPFYRPDGRDDRR